MSAFDDTAKRRIRFLTRRGLLELDIVLGRFMKTEFAQLSDAELAVLVEILDLPDQEFLAQVNGKEQPGKPAFLPLLEKIRRAQSPAG